MKRLILLILLAFTICPIVSADYPKMDTKIVIEQINLVREVLDLQELTETQIMKKTALNQCVWMFDTKIYAHDRPKTTKNSKLLADDRYRNAIKGTKITRRGEILGERHL